jgi:hypothetical protein
MVFTVVLLLVDVDVHLSDERRLAHVTVARDENGAIVLIEDSVTRS